MTLVRARLWPASPQRPHIAFTFDLLDWAEALLLECQIASERVMQSIVLQMPSSCCEGLVKCDYIIVVKAILFFYREKTYIHLSLMPLRSIGIYM